MKTKHKQERKQAGVATPPDKTVSQPEPPKPAQGGPAPVVEPPYRHFTKH